MSFNWQSHFPMLSSTMNGKRLAYLDSAATALKPLAVIQAMDNYFLKHTSNVHRGIYRLSEENTAHFEVVRDQVQDFLSAPERESIIFTKGTTEGINLVARSWGKMNLKAQDEILITELEHHANIVPWQMIAEETGAKVIACPLDDNKQVDLNAFERLLSSKTKIAAFTMVSNTLGVITPFKEMTKLAKKRGVTVLLDAAQAAPHMKLAVSELGCDFLVFSGHKIFGPTGVGVLWGRKDLLEVMPPYQGGGNMISVVDIKNGTTYNELPEKFEAGTPAIAEVLGLGAALSFIKNVGWSEIERRDHELLELATRELKKIPGLTIFGEKASRVATFGFEIKGIHPQDLGSVLDKEGVAIRTGHHCTQPLMKNCGVSAMARASFGPYNSAEDVNQLCQAIELARRLFL